jgi:two-component system KDP operon response regulator KdpE
VDSARRQITVDAHRLALTPTEYKLLCSLVARAEHVVSVAELAEAHWGCYDPSLDLSVRVHLRRIRAKLRAVPTHCPQLVGVRGFGYRLVWLADDTRPQT